MGFGAASTGQGSYRRSGRQQGEPSGPLRPATRWGPQFRTRRSARPSQSAAARWGRLSGDAPCGGRMAPMQGSEGQTLGCINASARLGRLLPKRRQLNRFRPMVLKRGAPRSRVRETPRPVTTSVAAPNRYKSSPQRLRSAACVAESSAGSREGEPICHRTPEPDAAATVMSIPSTGSPPRPVRPRSGGVDMSFWIWAGVAIVVVLVVGFWRSWR